MLEWSLEGAVTVRWAAVAVGFQKVATFLKKYQL